MESRDFLKLWLNSEVSWSAAGEGDAPGSPTCPFVPPRCGLLWSSEQELCVVLTCHPAFGAGLGHPLFPEVQCSIVKEWDHVTCYYMCVFVLLFLSPLFQEYGQQPKSQEGELKISAVFSVSGSPLGKE